VSVSASLAPEVTVIAIGNPYRGDDGVGAAVLSLVRDSLGCDARLGELDGEPVRTMLAWEGSSRVWIIDATSSDRPPGSIHEVDAARLREDDSAWRGVGGGHALGLSEAVDLAAVLGLLPVELRVLGIEGASFDHGEGLSPAVAEAVPVAAARLVDAIRRTPTPGRGPRR
jgi:hydrogenase maturation protease